MSFATLDKRTVPLRRKVCLIGAPGVGKTSVVRRRVDRCFAGDYRSTIGVRIDAIRLQTSLGEVMCMAWDLRGDEVDRPVEFGYLAGMSAFLLVVDVASSQSFEAALASLRRIDRSLGAVPFLLLLNKIDMPALERDRQQFLASLPRAPAAVFATSARTGQGVDEVFDALGERLLAGAEATAAPGAPSGDDQRR